MLFSTLTPPGPLRVPKAGRRANGSCDRRGWLSKRSHDRKAPDRTYALGAYRSLLATMLGTCCEHGKFTQGLIYVATWH